ncbi:MAG: PAS domain-containing sensor histidine kinase, partial [Myxococcota bacterium]|nr:PAS domain-containing sensor histidine kinase [Myxococcota bacterium]
EGEDPQPVIAVTSKRIALVFVAPSGDIDPSEVFLVAPLLEGELLDEVESAGTRAALDVARAESRRADALARALDAARSEARRSLQKGLEAHAEAEAERAKLREFVLRSPAALCLLRGPEHVFEVTNAPYVRLVGGRDVLGQPVRRALPEVEGQGFFELLDQVYATGEPFQGKELAIRLERANGITETVILDFVYQPMHASDGHIDGIAVYANDVTELVMARETARRSEAEYRAVFDLMPQLAWVARPDGHVEFYNRGWYAYTGTTFEEMQGWGWERVQDPEWLPEVLDRWRHSLETGAPFEMTFPLRRHDGVLRWFLTRVEPQRDEHGTIVRWIGINTDVDDQRRSALELDRALAIEKAARSEAERMVRFSEMFMGVLGHDLRTPLNATLMAAHMLTVRAEDDQSRRVARRIIRSSERMTRMIEQLLDFTRIRIGGGLALERLELELDVLARRILEEFEELDGTAGKPRFEREFLGLTSGEWDADRMGQVISNLAANAVQHGTAGRPILLRIDGTRADTVVMTVHNEGSMPPELLPELFDAFRGSRGVGSRARGLGLGLYITQQIVRAHGGEIDVTSSEPAGTTFRVRLPRRAPLAGAADVTLLS